MVDDDVDLSGRSAAWLAHLLWEQRVARSNRVAPTYFYESVCHGRSFFSLALCCFVAHPVQRLRDLA